MDSWIEGDVAVALIGSFSIWHWLIVLAIVLLLFGRGKISEVMGDVAKGVKSFKRGIADDDSSSARAASGNNAQRSVEHQSAEPAVAANRTEEPRNAG